MREDQTGCCTGLAIHCIFGLRGRLIGYDSQYGHNAVTAMGVDSIDLVWVRAIRCHANGPGDALRRHASRLDQTVRDAVACLAAMGLGDTAGASVGPPLSSNALAANRHLVQALGRLRRDRRRLCYMESRVGKAAQPM